MDPLLLGGLGVAALFFLTKKSAAAITPPPHSLPPPNVLPNPPPGGLPAPSGGGGGGLVPLGGGAGLITPGGAQAVQIVSQQLPPGLVATFQVVTQDTGTPGELNIRQHPNGPVVGTVPHLAVVGWDASPPLDDSGNVTDTTHPADQVWFHVTDFGHIGSPPGVDGFARSDFLKAL